MAPMDLVVVMDAIAATARDAGLPFEERVYEWPTLSVNPPCLVVGYPTELRYDATYARGADRGTFPAWVVCGRVDARSTRDLIAAYIGGPGEDPSVKSALDGTLGDAVASCRVTSATIEAVTISGVDYQSVRFDLDILT